MTVPDLTLVHVSDIHLRQGDKWTPHLALPGVHKPKPAEVDLLWSRIVARATSGSTAAVLSGDISLLGKDRDITYARRQWDAVTTGFAAHAYVLGNHDFWGGSVAKAGFASADTHARVKLAHWPTGGSAHVDIGSLRVRLYSVDTTPTVFRRNFFALGELRQNELAALRESITSDTETDARHGCTTTLRLAILHHPLLARLKWGAAASKVFSIDPTEARGASPPALEVVGPLAEAGVHLVLAGHVHSPGAHVRPAFAVKQIVCPSSTLSAPSPAFVVVSVDRSSSPHEVEAQAYLVSGAAPPTPLGAPFTLIGDPLS